MTRLSWFVAAALMLALVGMSVMYARAGAAGDPATGDETVQVAQAPGGDRGGRGGRPEMSEAERTRMREQMLERMLDQAGLTDREKAAAKNTMKAKEQARQALAGELDKLRRIANKSTPSDQELQDALAAYGAALADYRKKTEAEDNALAGQLSLRAQARCLSLGILDNGLGGFGQPGGFRPPGGARGPRPPR